MRNLSKRNVERIVTAIEEKQCVRVVYIKVIQWRLTTSEATALGVSRMYQLALLLAQQIGAGNLRGLSI